MELARQLAAAYRWQRGLGRDRRHGPACDYVVTPEHPTTWDANHVSGVRAASAEQIDSVFALLESAYPHSDWRVVQTDPFTPPAFMAELAMRGFAPVSTIVQMAAAGAIAAAPETALREVADEADWAALSRLAHANFAEAAPSGGTVNMAVARGLIAGYRAQPEMRFQLVARDGEPVAYGAGLACPGGIGMIEHLFTLPAWRRRGIASGLIAALAARLRAAGCATCFIGARADDAPRHLYQRLGFQPALLTQTWARRAARG